jgi:uncharacterized membrane protein YraQ (UPF0718 family)
MKEIVLAGLSAVKEYILLHVITCLVPAFLLAGGMVTFINKQAILRYLGEKASKIKSFSLASLLSFFVAACSCTVIPVASGLYYSGAGVGVAFIFLWVAPATNILSLVYTGSILGTQMAVSRALAAICMALVVGYVMHSVFGKEKINEVQISYDKSVVFIEGKELILLVLILLSLLAPNYIVQKGKYVYKVLVWLIFSIAMALYAIKNIHREKITSWLRESWSFVRIIFPLLLTGVFIVGIIGKIIPQQWVQKFLGGNTLKASFFATLLGAVSYFATMTEAPFVDTLIKLGTGKGPALALLLTGPGLSLPNWLAIAKVFGVKKAIVYILTIIVLGTLAGWFFGNVVF